MSTYDVNKIKAQLDNLQDDLGKLKRALDKRDPDDCVVIGKNVVDTEKALAKLLK